jgi:molybdate transport system substrate-binding protein
VDVSDVISGLSSMATRLLVVDLAEEVGRRHGIAVVFSSAGGVEVARSVRDGAQADVLVLGSAAMRALEEERLLVPGTVRALFVSQVVAAVPAESSTAGPSGTGLLDLVERWGLADSLRGRLVQAPPGVPVGSLLARGEADLGFQQHSELMDVPGIRLLGPLPGEAALSTTFDGAVLEASVQPDRARQVLTLLGDVAMGPIVGARGMALATPA